jgi:glycosyltransferase involved in cell wall biosynthesis
MTTLRVIVDEVLEPTRNGIARYAEELTRALIETAPPSCFVEGIGSIAPDASYAELRERIPGLGDIVRGPLTIGESSAAWQHGFTPLPSGMIHAPSLMAPLQAHDRLAGTGHQLVVTMHDTVAWSHPELLGPRRVAWHRSMAARAERYADAVVVPTHAVADQVSELFDFGDRVRVIGGAIGTRILPRDRADDTARSLALPSRYILAMGGLESRRGIDQVIAALGVRGAARIPPLLVVGPDRADGETVSDLVAASGVRPARVRALGELDDETLSVAIERAALVIVPSVDDGFGLSVLEAFRLGTPVIHSDAPGVVESAGDAGLIVEPGDDYPDRLAIAIKKILADREFAAGLSTQGSDRAGLFSWRASAEKIWQLHADL